MINIRRVSGNVHPKPRTRTNGKALVKTSTLTTRLCIFSDIWCYQYGLRPRPGSYYCIFHKIEFPPKNDETSFGGVYEC